MAARVVKLGEDWEGGALQLEAGQEEEDKGQEEREEGRQGGQEAGQELPGPGGRLAARYQAIHAPGRKLLVWTKGKVYL